MIISESGVLWLTAISANANEEQPDDPQKVPEEEDIISVMLRLGVYPVVPYFLEHCN